MGPSAAIKGYSSCAEVQRRHCVRRQVVAGQGVDVSQQEMALYLLKGSLNGNQVFFHDVTGMRHASSLELKCDALHALLQSL